MPTAGQKRKGPPTFRYFPPNRAKKLKKAWVETAKIKSKWKAQKRREGILSSHSELEPHEDGADIIDENDKGDSVTGAVDLEDTATAYSSSPDVKKHGNKIRTSPYDKSNNAEGSANTNKEQDKQSLRDLFRKAYSKESLHTYKSGRQQGRGRGRGRGQGGGTEGKAASMRGQPNMKLRMNAMLEKIKQDYS